MKKYLIQYLSIIIITAFYTSCTPLYYPNKLNVPLMTNKGEGQGNIAYGFNGLDLQGAYAVTENIAIMGNFSYMEKSDHSHRFGELGAGYYTKLSEVGRFEVFGGYGYGTAETYYDNLNYAKGLYHRIFLQPTIGFTSKIVDGGLSLRPVFVSFPKISGTTFTSDNLNLLFIEPAFTLKIGYKNVKSVIQIGYAVLLGASDFNTPNPGYLGYSFLFSQPFLFTVGLNFNLGKYNAKQEQHTD